MPLYPETKRFLELIPEVDPDKVGVDAFRKGFRDLSQMLPREPVDRIEDIKSARLGSDRTSACRTIPAWSSKCPRPAPWVR